MQIMLFKKKFKFFLGMSIFDTFLGYLSKGFWKFIGTFIGTLLEFQKKPNEETQYIVVKNSVHHKIL